MKFYKKIIAGFLSAGVLAASMMTPCTVHADAGKTYVSLGADLTESQRATVLQLLGVSESDLTNDTVVTVTNAEEHQYLDSYIAPSVIGTRALSSCRVTEQEKGYGIKVTTYNISYVTADMYQNALATAGIKDAQVIVAGPTVISGTAALIGATEAYAKMNGEVIQPQVIDGATNELVTTAEVAEATGDAEKSAELIAAVKEVVVAKDIKNDADIDKVIDDVAQTLGLTISEELKAQIRSLMKQLSELDLDTDAIAQQAKEVYEKLKADGLNLSEYGISEEEVQGFFDKLSALLKGLIDWIRGLFN